MNISEQILLNQLAQGLVEFSEGRRWFSALDEDQKRAALRELSSMIAHCSPRREDAINAIASSGLKATYTPCVLLTLSQLPVQLAKIAGLPQNELMKAFQLLVALLGNCDARRRAEKPLDTVNHWWHRDLSDPNVVIQIKKQFGDSSDAGRVPGFPPRRIK